MGKKRSVIPALGLLNQVGISMLVPIFGCMLLGGLIDSATGHTPLWLLIFTVLGVGAAFRNMFYIITKEAKKGRKDE